MRENFNLQPQILFRQLNRTQKPKKSGHPDRFWVNWHSLQFSLGNLQNLISTIILTVNIIKYIDGVTIEGNSVRFFGKKKSFNELVDEYYETHKTWNAQSLKRQLKIVKQLSKIAKTDKEKILANSLMLETKRRMSSTPNI